MKEKKTAPDQFTDLRRRAEEAMRDQPADSQGLPAEEVKRLAYELYVYQIELEMQNAELRQAQQELETSRDRYVDLYDFAPIGYFTLSEQGLILEVNLTGATMLGVDRSDLIKQPLPRFIVREDQDIYYFYRRELFETQAPQVCEVRLVKKDNSQFYARIESTVARDKGNVVWRAAVSDITGQVQAEEACRVLVDCSLQGLTLLQTDRIVFVNSTLAKMLGYPVETLMSMSAVEMIEQIVHPEERTVVAKRLQDRLAGKRVSAQDVVRIIRQDGAIRWFEQFFTLLEFQGEPTLQIAHVDITERKQMEEALRESEKSLRSLLNLITDGCWVLDSEWRCTLVNEAGASLMGMLPDQLVGRKLTALFPGIEKTEFFAAYGRSMRERTTENVTGPFTFLDGRKETYEVRVYPVPDGILCIGKEITERKRAEEALDGQARRDKR